MELLRKIAFLTMRERHERNRASLLLLAMILAAVFEAAGVGMVMPFVALVQDPSVGTKWRSLRFVRALLGVETDRELLFGFGLLLVGVFLLKNLYLFLVQRTQFRFIYQCEATLSRRLVDRYLSSDYTFHLQNNSAALIQSVMLEVYKIANHVLVALFTIAVESLTMLVVLGAMVAVEPFLVPLVGLVIALAALGFYRAVRRKSLALGARENQHQAQMLKSLQHALGGIKEAQVLGVERYFLDSFAKESQGFGQAQAEHHSVSLIPRYVLESLGIVGLVGISLGMLLRGRSSGEVLPVLGVLAIAAVRLLPSLARVLASLTDLQHNVPSVVPIYETLASAPPRRDLTQKDTETVPFAKAIEFRSVSYAYPAASGLALREASLTIENGETIAFVGGSGAGKTTIADLLIGLLRPTEGQILVDELPIDGANLFAWRRHVGYIPQNVYLSDDSMRRNVAFGVRDPDIDDDRVRRAIQMAQLTTLIDSLPDGLETFVGERGVRLSGGQRQRIGIARALYLKPQVLVLDEATSALDSRTEKEIVDALENIRGSCTTVVIAHRLSTVRSADRLVVMKDGAISAVGTWDQLLESSPIFRDLVALSETSESA